MRDVFILVPSFLPTGPVKGGLALAKALAKERRVMLVAVKGIFGRPSSLAESVDTTHLTGCSTIRERVKTYREMLERAGGRERVTSISFCFSADVVNLFSWGSAITCASVRGNLVRNYRMDYGLPGAALAAAHLASLARFDHIVVMTEAMADQVRRFTRRAPAVIGNFVDEAEIEPYRRARPAEGSFRFVFVGSLSPRKQPLLLVRSVHALLREGVSLQLELVGDGPLRQAVIDEIARFRLGEHVTVHGQLSDPFPILAGADAMVLPSLSEGISRSSLEALYLGVPCVLRDVDGNRELVRPRRNGELFGDDSELPAAMLSAARLARSLATKGCLLPDAYREREAARKYLELVESI